MFNDLSIRSEDLPKTIPVFPLSGALLLPGIEIPLNIFEPRYVKMIDDAMAEKRLLGLVQPEQKFYSKLIKNKPLYKVGCLGKIRTFNETDDGRYMIILSGVSRFELDTEISSDKDYRKFEVNYDKFKEDFLIKKLREDFTLDLSKTELMKKIDSYLKGSENYTGLANINELMNTESAFLIDFLCSYMPFSAQEKQLFIESKTIEERAKTLYKVLGLAEAEAKVNIHNNTMH